MMNRVDRDLGSTLSQKTFKTSKVHFKKVQQSDLWLCIVIFMGFALATIIQFKVISQLVLSPQIFVMPSVMSVVMSVIVVWLRQSLRHLQYERDQHEFVRAQVQLLNHRLKDLLNERTTLLIQAQDQVVLAQSRADLGAMASGVIHDINNALMSINLNWELLQNAPDEELHELQMSMDAALTQAINITHDFKFFLRPKDQAYAEAITILRKVTSFLNRSMMCNQRLSLHYSDHSSNTYNDIHNDIYNDIYSDIYSNKDRDDPEGLSLERSGPTEISKTTYTPVSEGFISNTTPVYVGLSEGQLTQIIMNLVVNARDALQGHSGEVNIVISTTSSDVSILVQDTGVGMTPEVQLRAFEPFYTTKPEGEGTGLGLHVLDQIVRRAGGSIDLESELNLGTIFTVTLPLLSLSEVPAHD